MLKKVDRLICAWISLMLEKHTDKTGFELKDVLFTREELANRANLLFPLITQKVHQYADLDELTAYAAMI